MPARPITLFTGQWADMPLDALAAKAASWGYDGLELACWGDHFDVRRALTEDDYCDRLRERLARHGLAVYAVSNHFVGQAVCDPIDARHQRIVPAHVWGDGDAEGVRRRAADEMRATARAARRLGVSTVNGFTGSSIWHLLYGFPPLLPGTVDRGFDDFAARWRPSSTAAPTRACASPSRCTRPRSPSTCRRRARARGGRRAPGVRLQLRPQPLRLPGRRLRGLPRRARAVACYTAT
jgi:hypothetical protein